MHANFDRAYVPLDTVKQVDHLFFAARINTECVRGATGSLDLGAGAGARAMSPHDERLRQVTKAEDLEELGLLRRQPEELPQAPPTWTPPPGAKRARPSSTS